MKQGIYKTYKLTKEQEYFIREILLPNVLCLVTEGPYEKKDFVSLNDEEWSTVGRILHTLDFVVTEGKYSENERRILLQLRESYINKTYIFEDYGK